MTANIYLYYPFDNYKEDPTAAKGLEYFQQTGLPCTLLDPSSGADLSVVKDDDLLLIYAHGDINTPGTLYLCKSDNTEETLTANDLAVQLQQKKLKKTHQSILMIACYAGGASTLKAGTAPGTGGVVASPNLIVQKNKMNECFASVLGKCLGLKGYYSILVGGFPGIFSPISYSINGVSAFQADGTRVRAQLDHIQWFDARGART